MPQKPIEHKSGGYQISQSQIFIDPLQPVPCAIVTHAHGDHAVPGHEHLYCHPHTAALLEKRFTYPARRIIPCEYGEPFEIDGLRFSLHPAGHMLGSAQIRWTQQDRTIVFTGDFKTEPDATCAHFETVACDILITEVTFGSRVHSHPEPREALKIFDTLTDNNILIGAYALGKAQRLNYLINLYHSDWRVMLHPSMVPYHKVYEQCGFPPGKWEPYRREAFRRDRKIACLVPPQALLNFHRGFNYVKAFATGWKEKGDKFDVMLPISDHADWEDLLQTVKQSGAREIWLVHGEGEEMREELERLSYTVNIL